MWHHLRCPFVTLSQFHAIFWAAWGHLIVRCVCGAVWNVAVAQTFGLIWMRSASAYVRSGSPLYVRGQWRSSAFGVADLFHLAAPSPVPVILLRPLLSDILFIATPAEQSLARKQRLASSACEREKGGEGAATFLCLTRLFCTWPGVLTAGVCEGGIP